MAVWTTTRHYSCTSIWKTLPTFCGKHPRLSALAYTLPTSISRTDAIKRFTSNGYIVNAASSNNTFYKVVWSINDWFEAPFQPIKVATFWDYYTGLATYDVQALVQWLSEEPLSVTMNKLAKHLKFLKTMCNIIWNVCHPKNTIVSQENNMFPTFRYVVLKLGPLDTYVHDRFFHQCLLRRRPRKGPWHFCHLLSQKI